MCINKTQRLIDSNFTLLIGVCVYTMDPSKLMSSYCCVCDLEEECIRWTPCVLCENDFEFTFFCHGCSEYIVIPCDCQDIVEEEEEEEVDSE